VRPPFGSSLRPWLCAAGESAILIMALLAATALRSANARKGVLHPDLLVAKALVNALVVQLCFYYNDLYEDVALRQRMELYLRLGKSLLVGAVILMVVYYAVPVLEVGRGIMALYLALAYAAIVAWRVVFAWTAGRERLTDRVLILGTGQSAQQIAVELQRRRPAGFAVVGFVGEAAAEVGRNLIDAPVVGTTMEIFTVVQAQRVNLIVVALDDRRGKMPMSDLLRCRLAGVRVEEATTFYERLAGKILVHNLRPSWLLFGWGFNRARLFQNTKRLLDVLAAGALLVVLSPLLALIAALIRLTSPGPVLYRQSRVGERGRVFAVLKFRSMRLGAEAATGPVWATEGFDSRVTVLGRYLRKFRLDELPQLLNILRGEMSFVGPRPERPHFIEVLRKVVPYYDERHTVKPGVTGWAQIKFGYGSSIEDAQEKLQFDLYYLRHMSMTFDVGILLDTLKIVALGRGAR
jgi:sugar transferase (PEP-CTERM system associated)